MPKREKALKTPGNAGFLEMGRVSQLGYGDVIVSILQQQGLYGGADRTAEKVARKRRADSSADHRRPQSLATRGILAGFGPCA